MTIGENIKRIRKEKGLTQKQLADKLKCATGTIQQYELGKRQPRIEQLKRIATALDVDVWELIEFNIIDVEHRNLFEETTVATYNGTIATLKEIYGNVEEKTVYGENGGESLYYLVGDKDKFVLYDADIETLMNTIKATIPPIVERIKDTRSESEIVKEIKEEIAEAEKKIDNK